MSPLTATRRRLGCRSIAGLLALLLTCIPLTACFPSSGTALDIPGFDPDATDPDTRVAFEYLNPDGEMDGRLWMPGERTRERWRMLNEGDWNSVGLEELTAAMAAVSTMRSSQDDAESAAATWTVARSIEFAVDEVPFEDYTEAMKENLAVVVANTADQAVLLTAGASVSELGLYRDDDDKETSDAESLYTTLIYRVIDNEKAAATISDAFLDAAMARYSDITEARQIGSMCEDMGDVYGYLNAIGSERMVDIVGVDADFDNPITITRSMLQAQAYAVAVDRGLFTDPEAFNPEYLQDEYGESYSWYTTNADGNTSFDLDDPPTSLQSIEVHDWADDIATDHDPEGVIAEANAGINRGANEGPDLIHGRDGPGGDPGAIEIKQD